LEQTIDASSSGRDCPLACPKEIAGDGAMIRGEDRPHPIVQPRPRTNYKFSVLVFHDVSIAWNLVVPEEKLPPPHGLAASRRRGKFDRLLDAVGAREMAAFRETAVAEGESVRSILAKLDGAYPNEALEHLRAGGGIAQLLEGPS
jgi:hypothetical protein